MTKAVCIVQARMTSSRLPGKVLENLGGKSVLAHVLERCAATPGLDKVVVAIPDEDADESVAEEASRLGFPVWRGSRDDVLSRFHGAAVAFGADVILRVTSDCPLTDPAINGKVLSLITPDIDYACNNTPPQWPHGLDAEAFTFHWLDRANKEARRPSEREHVSPFIRNHPAARKASLPGPGEPEVSWRWTLDTPDDLVFLRTLFSRMPQDLQEFDWTIPAAVMRKHPELATINAEHDRLAGLKKSLRADAVCAGKTAIIRCDASPGRGGGHLMRCLALSHGLSALGWSCHFAVADGSFEAAGQTRPPNTLELCGNAVTDPEALRRWRPQGCDLLVVDHYDLDNRWEESLHGWASTLLTLDDLPGRPHPGAVLSSIPLPQFGPGPWLCGPNWAVLDPEFVKIRHNTLARRQALQPVEKIVVSFGLTDPDNATCLALDALRTAARGIAVDVVIGSGSPWLTAITATAATLDPPARVMVDARDIPRILAAADLAIGAGGGSAFERCCLGLPSIQIQIADNQKETGRLLSGCGATLDLGPQKSIHPAQLNTAIRSLLHDPQRRAAMSRAAASLCDGRGLYRALCALLPEWTPSGTAVTLRPVRHDDACAQRLLKNQAPAPEDILSAVVAEDHDCGILCLSPVPPIEETAETFILSVILSEDGHNPDITAAALALARRLAPHSRLLAHPSEDMTPDLLVQAGYRPGKDNLFVQEASP